MKKLKDKILIFLGFKKVYKIGERRSLGKDLKRVYTFAHFLYDIKYYFYEKPSTWWYNFKKNVKNLYVYRKIIWNDRTWGYDKLIDLIIFKLRLDANAFEKRNITESSATHVQEMRECANLLEKWIKDEYMDKYSEKHNEKWGKSDMIFETIDSDGTSRLINDTDEKLSPELREQKRTEYNEYSELADLERKRDLNNALRIMALHIEEWWD